MALKNRRYYKNGTNCRRRSEKIGDIIKMVTNGARKSGIIGVVIKMTQFYLGKAKNR
jgi:hypothetical protein